MPGEATTEIGIMRAGTKPRISMDGDNHLLSSLVSASQALHLTGGLPGAVHAVAKKEKAAMVLGPDNAAAKTVNAVRQIFTAEKAASLSLASVLLVSKRLQSLRRFRLPTLPAATAASCLA